VKFKIDENLPAVFAVELRDAGHEADTVRDEKLEGATDDVVLATCDRESRVLFTEDLDFANVVAYPPDRHKGIVVMRTRQQGLGALSAFRRLVLPNLGSALVGRLWIVEDDRVRVHGGQTP
jgi:predicted nuclease of predicted toxin-antitoxin system